MSNIDRNRRLAWLVGLAGSLMLALGGPALAQDADGYWKLDRSEFFTGSGTMEWPGQGGQTVITVLAHDNEKFTIHEKEYRGYWSQTYVVGFHVPDRLIPGEAAPFELSVGCTQSDVAEGWPFKTTTMTIANLVADLRRDSYQEISNSACVVGKTLQAEPLGWTVAPGKAGDTTLVRAAAVPTFAQPVEQRFYFVWAAGAPPVAPAAAAPQAQTPPAPQAEAQPAVATPPPPRVDPILQPIWTVPAGNTGKEPLPDAGAPMILRNGADGAVSAGASKPTQFKLDAATRIAQIMTYHYGAWKKPGTIALKHQDGTVFGPWPAAGAVGAGQVTNAYWWVKPNITLKPGRYTVIDSDPATWSVEAATHGAGIVVIWGKRL